MKRLEFLFGSYWTGWRRGVAWTVCLVAIFLLGLLGIRTDSELTFSSLATLPVLVIAWIDGKRNGLIVAFVAAAMWLIGDLASERQFDADWIPWANAITRQTTYSVAALLVAQIRLQLEREHRHATHDGLTGLQNRRAFFEAGSAEVERARRYAHPLAVIFLDLDDFKQLNDSTGHDAGDAALKATAKALLQALRSSDRVARMGGDEFAVLLPETGYRAAVETGRKILVAVNAALAAYPPVSISIGVAWFGEADRLFPDMLKAADDLMYQAKQGGKHDIRSRDFEATTG